jgi:RNA polymerase sigma-70 factor (ECF subfamily)
LPRKIDAKCSKVGASPEPLFKGQLAELSDQALLEGIRNASEPHFTELYQRYFDRIYNFVHSRIRNHADAEEISQETFVTVFRSIGSYRGQASLLSWIYGVARNLTNNSIRRVQSQNQKLHSVDPEDLMPRPTIGRCAPDEQLFLRRYTRSIREQFESLGDWQKRVFEMRHLENLSISEIAERTDRSSDAIRSSLYRTKRMMLETANLAGEPAAG